MHRHWVNRSKSERCAKNGDGKGQMQCNEGVARLRTFSSDKHRKQKPACLETVKYLLSDFHEMLSFQDPKDYMKVCHNPRYWRSTVHLVLQRHKLMETEEPYLPTIFSLGEGTNPVFLVRGWQRCASPQQQDKEIHYSHDTGPINVNTSADEFSPVQCVVKLFSPYFGGKKAYRTETDFYRLLPHNPNLNGRVPRLLARGYLGPDSSDDDTDDDIPGLIAVHSCSSMLHRSNGFSCSSDSESDGSRDSGSDEESESESDEESHSESASENSTSPSSVAPTHSLPPSAHLPPFSGPTNRIVSSSSLFSPLFSHSSLLPPSTRNDHLRHATTKATTFPHWHYDQFQWPWPYIVTEFLSASPIIRVFDFLTSQEVQSTAQWLGKWLPEVHRLPLEHSKHFVRRWAEFEHFLLKQRRNALATHRKWKLLNDSQLAELEMYLPQNVRDLFQHEVHLSTGPHRANPLAQGPFYLHGDLSDEQILGVFYDAQNHVVDVPTWIAFLSSIPHPSAIATSSSPNTNDSGSIQPITTKTGSQTVTNLPVTVRPPPHPAEWHWEPLYIVDFADACVGDRTYELIPIHVSLFRCNKDALVTFLKSYASHAGLPVEAVWGPPQTFSYRLMCYTLLHVQDALRTVWEFRPELRRCSTLTELQDKLWGINFT